MIPFSKANSLSQDAHLANLSNHRSSLLQLEQTKKSCTYFTFAITATGHGNIIETIPKITEIRSLASWLRPISKVETYSKFRLLW